MKNYVLVSLMALFLLSSCACHRFGVKTGMNLASINGDDTDNLDSRVAFFFGGFAELCVTDEFSVQPELLYSMQGAKYSESEGYDGKFKFDYLNIPVMGRYYVSDAFSIEAGPQIGFLLSAKDEYDLIGGGESGEEDVKDWVSSTDFGANVGLGYQFENGLNLGARYYLGLSNINDFDGSDDYKNQNGVLQISVGFRF